MRREIADSRFPAESRASVTHKRAACRLRLVLAVRLEILKWLGVRRTTGERLRRRRVSFVAVLVLQGTSGGGTVRLKERAPSACTPPPSVGSSAADDKKEQQQQQVVVYFVVTGGANQHTADCSPAQAELTTFTISKLPRDNADDDADGGGHVPLLCQPTPPDGKSRMISHGHAIRRTIHANDSLHHFSQSHHLHY
jgi:hypothetical protein